MAASAAADVSPPPHSSQVRIFFNIPPGLSTYTTEYHPITFGVPFPAGTLKATDQLRIVNQNGVIQAAAFDRKTRWDGTFVKWVHIDLLVPVKHGQIPAMFLQFGPTVPAAPPTSTPLIVTPLKEGGYSVNTQAGTFTVGPKGNEMSLGSRPIGAFILKKELNGVTTSYTPSGRSEVTYETGDIDTPEIPDSKNGIRATIKVIGQYTASDGQTASQFITRYRFYARSSTIRIDHTVIRVENDGSKIASLEFSPRVSPIGNLNYGLDQHNLSTSLPIDLRQIVSDRVVNPSRDNVGKQIEGWVQKKSATRAQFIGLRWPWQQYPTRITAVSTPNGLRPTVHLIGPETPMGLEAEDHVIPPLKNFNEANWNIPERKAPYQNALGTKINPIGVGKTYELMFWEAGPSDPTFGLAPEVRNQLLQHPIYAYADPEWVVKAELPGPNAAKDMVHHPTIEKALDASFDWMTRQRKEEFDYGIWNFGDVQFDWNLNATWKVSSEPYRYWMNQGKGWGAVPWMLWMRSGDRKYIEKAGAHSRHSMDVDTGHVDDPKQGRHKGGTNDYRPVHFGEANFPVGIWNDSEYLSYAFHLEGYERAADVILERQHALLTSNDEPVIPDTNDLLNQLENPKVPFLDSIKLELRCTRDHYRTFGELAIIYEETHHPELMMLAERFLNAFEKCQAKNGWMPGVKTAEWFSQSFLIAARAFPGWKHCIVKLLQGWEEHIGMREKPSLTGQVEGPTSLWTLLELEKKTGDPMYGRAIAGYASARALGVYADDLTDFTNSNPETIRWRGYSTIHGYHLARVMRDWMTALARLAAPNMPVVSTEPAGMAYFRGHLPAEIPVCERVGRHVIYVLEETDQPFDVQLDFAGENQGIGGSLLIRVYDPDATAVSLPSQEINRVFENNLVDAADPAAPFKSDDMLETVNGRKGKSDYDKAKTIRIPADRKTGAYAIEVISRGTATALGIAARSSLGRAVHYIPPYEDRLNHFLTHSGEFCETELRLCPPAKDSPSSLDSACSHNLNQMLASLSGMQQEEGGVAGRAWFQPKANATVTLEFADGATKEPNFNFALYNPALKLRVFEGTVEKCTTKISGSSGASPLEKPTTQSCTFVTGSNPALHNVVLLNYENYRLHTEGTGEFFASSQEEWFDPTMVNHPPQTRFLSPEVH